MTFWSILPHPVMIARILVYKRRIVIDFQCVFFHIKYPVMQRYIHTDTKIRF